MKNRNPHLRSVVLAVVLILVGVGSAWAETCWLRQSTTIELKIGPFLQSAEGTGQGYTPMTALTISQADVRLKKLGGAWAQKNDATSCAHEENGNYECPLNTTDTDTAGRLEIHVSEATGVPVWKTCMVLPQHSFDMLVGTTGLHQAAVVTTKPDVRKTSTGVILTLPIKSALTGAPLPGLAYNSAGLTAEYCRTDQVNNVCTPISPLVTATRGTWVTGGLIEKDVTAALVELHVPNAAWATGADEVTITLSGATVGTIPMAPTIVTLGLFDISGADLLQTMGTPSGADMSADIATIKAKTDPLLVNANGVVTAGGGWRKNIAGQPKIPLFMRDSTNTALPKTGLTLVITISKDGAAFGAGTGTAAEIGSGFYTFAPSQADLNCDLCVFNVTATGAVATGYTIHTAP